MMKIFREWLATFLFVIAKYIVRLKYVSNLMEMRSLSRRLGLRITDLVLKRFVESILPIEIMI